MARSSGVSAVLGLGIGAAAFFFLSKQPIVKSAITSVGDMIGNAFGDLTPAQAQAAKTAGTPPANVTTDPITLGSFTIPSVPINIPVYTGPGSKS